MPVSRGLLALVIASFAFGSSAILVRLATQGSAISLAFLRLSIAATLMIMLAASTRQMTKLGKRDLTIVAVSGALLSLHFLTFIFAVKETTVANATFLVNTGPIMLAVLSPLVLRERTTAREGIGVLLGTFGVILVAGKGSEAFNVGDFSALLAAFFVACYSLAGRNLRTAGMSTAAYTSYVYSIAALVSLLFVFGTGAQPVRPYDLQNAVAILGLALIPTGLGHSLYNYALGSVKTVTASLFPLSEPIIASVLAAFLFGEIPRPLQIAGYMFIILAVVAVVTGLKEPVMPAIE